MEQEYQDQDQKKLDIEGSMVESLVESDTKKQQLLEQQYQEQEHHNQELPYVFQSEVIMESKHEEHQEKQVRFYDQSLNKPDNGLSIISSQRVDEENPQPSLQFSQPQPEVGIQDSQQTVDMVSSITEIQFNAQQEVQINHLHALSYQSASQTRITKIIVKDEAEPKKKKKKHEDEQYFMGYFKWYWGQHGFLAAFKNFLGKRIVYGIFFNFFNGIGVGIGSFYLKRLYFDKVGLGNLC
ncbi:UNKNOWN [Stylonychia lemnae]|uniref:Transmembrane protein n=1 Tax=Stylonychia lemnae TaxID=5949 RepID=A0A078BCA0_STYLE|nr:UNKNOWN [Stylonychia lemnae]|eukprot:CDW91223.1 UNKNOWN [Stylonychia lemnae]